ncbi:MAG: hypothetical protein D6729_08380 [Deltaproteobacteria bacterium]|nr:MAG: hypothetical protein D6729_08380 [Deltaproteobacteria bacterium]
MARPPQNKNAEIAATIDQLDEELNELKVRYEQYFLGMELRAPTQRKEQLRQKLMALKREFIRNTALKFKLNTLWNKYLSYERMWERTVKEIEEGRYRRDVFKARLRSRARQEQSARETAKKTRPAAKQRGVDGLPDEKLEKLFNAFVTAKKRCKEDTSGLSLEAMRRSLAKQIPAIKKKHNAKSVDFKVVIKNGKAVLKAVPR